MKPGLNTALKQHLILTPQLRQSLALLQMSALELEQELATAVETNPLLDWAEPEPAAASGEAPAVMPAETTFSEQLVLTEATPEPVPDELESPDLSPWESGPPTPGSAPRHDEPTDDIGQRTAATEGLHEHLEWQLRLTRLSPREQLIGEALIDAIDDNGYLSEPFSAIKAAVHPDISAHDDEIGTILTRIQCFDPPGVGARDLAECLTLQLDTLPAGTPARALARRAVCELLDRLPRLGAVGVAGTLGCTPLEAEQALALIRSLDPHPGAQIGAVASDHYLTPDCIITRTDSGWQVTLANTQRTRLTIHHGYEQIIGHASDKDNHYLRRHLSQARALLKNIQARGQTLLKVVEYLVQRQSGFLHHGPAALHPLTLREVADDIGLHESTVSRAIAHKYVQTPRGTLALKDFFASGIDRQDGDGSGTSSAAISQMVRELIAAEPPDKPLSDAKLTRALNAKGIPVARRTIAKYREALNIPASHERVRLE